MSGKSLAIIDVMSTEQFCSVQTVASEKEFEKQKEDVKRFNSRRQTHAAYIVDVKRYNKPSCSSDAATSANTEVQMNDEEKERQTATENLTRQSDKGKPCEEVSRCSKGGEWHTLTMLICVQDEASRLMPGPGQMSGLRISGKSGWSTWKEAEEALDPMRLGEEWKNHYQFFVTSKDWVQDRRGDDDEDSDDSWHDDTSPVPWTQIETVDVLNPGSKKQHAVNVQFLLRFSDHTRAVELKALEALKAEKPDLLSYYATFQAPPPVSSLETHYPSFSDPNLIQDIERRRAAEEIINSFDAHQKDAYKSLALSQGADFFLPGCAGSGKTYWILSIATLLQLDAKRPKVLLLMDINKPLTEVAQRMARQYRKFNLPYHVIRLCRWSLNKSHRRGPPQLSEDTRFQDTCPDFNSSLQGVVARCGPHIKVGESKDEIQAKLADSWTRMRLDNTRERPVSLDEAACDHLSRNRIKSAFRACVAEVERGWLPSQHHDLVEMDPRTAKAMYQGSLEALYAATLAECPFVAATPVTAALEFFSQHFNPDVIMFDEAGHARELATLVPAAYFNARLRVFVGDHRQSQPWMYTPGHEHSDQIRVSLLERAVFKAQPQAELMMNRRAYAGLHLLPSQLFYEGKMVSHNTSFFPDSVHSMMDWMDKKRGRHSFVPRILVNHGDSRWERTGSGLTCHNPAHAEVALKYIREVLGHSWFTRPNLPDSPGSVLLITTAKGALNEYNRKLKLWSPMERERVQVRTVETAQGMEADLVVVDIVKASDYVDEKHRLCVTLSRAVQGEVIIMSYRMKQHAWGEDGHFEPYHLGRLWDHCRANEQVLSILSKEAKERRLNILQIAADIERRFPSGRVGG